MTTAVWHYTTVLLVVFALNLLPAFAPPTWVVLVLFKLNWHLAPAGLVVIGAVAAAAGRFWLATGTGRLRSRLSPRRRESLEALRDYLTGHRGRSALGLALFMVSPLPSAQLFEAAGLLAAPLLPITAVFLVGRLVSYSLYIGAATVAERSLGSTLVSTLTSPAGIAVQVLLVLSVVLLARVDWAGIIRRGPGRRPGRGAEGPAPTGSMASGNPLRRGPHSKRGAHSGPRPRGRRRSEERRTDERVT